MRSNFGPEHQKRRNVSRRKRKQIVGHLWKQRRGDTFVLKSLGHIEASWHSLR
jgi:hypothetical protein